MNICCEFSTGHSITGYTTWQRYQHRWSPEKFRSLILSATLSSDIFYVSFLPKSKFRHVLFCHQIPATWKCSIILCNCNNSYTIRENQMKRKLRYLWNEWEQAKITLKRPCSNYFMQKQLHYKGRRWKIKCFTTKPHAYIKKFKFPTHKTGTVIEVVTAPATLLTMKSSASEVWSKLHN